MAYFQTLVHRKPFYTFFNQFASSFKHENLILPLHYAISMYLSLPQTVLLEMRKNSLFFLVSRSTILLSKVLHRRNFFVHTYTSNAGHELCETSWSTKQNRELCHRARTRLLQICQKVQKACDSQNVVIEHWQNAAVYLLEKISINASFQRCRNGCHVYCRIQKLNQCCLQNTEKVLASSL